MDRTALSYWFPRIEAAGLPVPRTKTFKMTEEVPRLNALIAERNKGAGDTI